ncbi:MAG: M56 family metallopeptidase [Clostridia bacterium]|nr:M56 family metallopeptidase [Clostridia bacterium]
MTGFAVLGGMLWDAASSVLVHGLLFGTVVLALILLGRRLLHAMPRRAAVWLWLPLLLLVFSPLLPGFGIEVPALTESELPGIPVTEQITADAVPSVVTTEPLPDGVGVLTTVTSPDVHIRRYPAWQSLVGGIWLVGMVCVLGWKIRRHIDVRRLCRTAWETERRGRIRICTLPGIRTPFVRGLLRPCIYIPAESDRDADARNMILLHEQAHVQRLDVLWRLLWEAALCVYWFQPLLWLAEDRFIADTEGACDEAVLASLGADRACRAAYAETLLLYADASRRRYPTAFGVTELQGRVQAILHPAALHVSGIFCLCISIVLASAAALCSPVPMLSADENWDSGGSVISDIVKEPHTVALSVEPSSALFGFADGYLEAHPDIWGKTTVQFALPLGWTLDFSDDSGIRGQIMDDTGTQRGFCFVQAFTPIDGEGIPPENVPPDDRKWQAIYHDLRLSAMQNVADDDYHPIVTGARFENAVAVMDQAIYEEGVPAAAWEHQRVPLVLAYDQDCSMYLQLTFDARVESETMKDIAASVTFEKVQ